MKTFNPTRILIVDDDPDILASLNDVVELEMEDCLIELASSVKQATSLAQQTKFDIALLDIKLGQDSGLDLLQELKLIHPDIACVMMTAHRDNKYTVNAVRFGASDYLYKPVKPNELIQTITRLLKYQCINREVAEADRRFHTVFEQATQWLLISDNEGRFIDANNLAMSFIRETKLSLIGKTIWDTPWYSLTETQKILQTGLEEVNKGSLFNSEFRFLDHESNWLTYELYMKPVFDEKNEVSQVVVESRDITSRKKAEDDIKKLNSSLETRVKERTIDLEQSLLLLTEENKERIKAEDIAKKANAAKSDFLSQMSHELRTPMNAILGFAQILDLDKVSLNESQQSSVNEILAAGDHLLQLINEVLDLTAIESGNLEISIDEVNVDDVIKQCVSLTHPLAQARQITLIDNISGRDYKLQADFIRLKQTLLNLLSNAVKYNKDGGTITLDSKVIDNQRLRISVKDDGEGIEKEDLGKLFKSFERLNTKFNVEGTGIGLVITKSLIDLMGGSIGVESTPGEGSAFWIELALAEVSIT